MSKQPLGSSTPNSYQRITRRRGVHSFNDEEILSPVTLNRSRDSVSPQTRSPIAQKHSFRSSSDLEDSEGSSGDEQIRLSYKNSSSNSSKKSASNILHVEGRPYLPLKLYPELKKFIRHNNVLNINGSPYILDSWNVSDNFIQDQNNNFWTGNKIMIGFIITTFILVVITLQNSFQTEIVSLDAIKAQFPLQDQDFWDSVESGLNEVIKFEKPSVFLFLYKETGESTTERILTNISTYASCILNSNCEEKPIILSSEELNNEALTGDGGYLLTTYKNDLEAVHVMIVKNLENIPSYVAKDLHSFCDEISPAVQKSVFFLTMKVSQFPKGKLKYVRALLREKWFDIKEDQFEPLFARISGMILAIHS